MNKKAFLSVKDISYMGLFVAFITVCAWLTVPSTVPFTMQTFAVFTCIGLLGCKKSFFCVIAYIALGAFGIPVFSGFSGGVSVLFGSTGGYIFGFIFITLISGIIINFFGKSVAFLSVAFLAGLLACYVFGTLWFMLFYTRNTGAVGIATVLSWCVLPYIIPDIIKIVLAIFITKGIGKYIKL